MHDRSYKMRLLQRNRDREGQTARDRDTGKYNNRQVETERERQRESYDQVSVLTVCTQKLEKQNIKIIPGSQWCEINVILSIAVIINKDTFTLKGREQ